jgi:hypothetical protein
MPCHNLGMSICKPFSDRVHLLQRPQQCERRKQCLQSRSYETNYHIAENTPNHSPKGCGKLAIVSTNSVTKHRLSQFTGARIL